MLKFAANITTMFNEFDFTARFEQAAIHSFAGVEYLFPYNIPPSELARHQRDFVVDTVLFNLPPGDWAAGDRGLAALPGRENEFRASLNEARRYADSLGTRLVHAMAGVPSSDNDPRSIRSTYMANLRYAAEILARDGITLLIEPINRRDMPGYALHSLETATAIVAEIGMPNLRVQADVYHMQIEGGDISSRLRTAFDQIDHIQIASIPDRHEPDGGELSYTYIFEQLLALGYDGWIGCEYRPRGDTVAGLGWLREAKRRAAQ